MKSSNMKFSFSNKEKEIVNVTVPEVAASISTAKEEEIYYERVEAVNNNINIEDKYRSVGKTKKETILSSLEIFDKDLTTLLRDYYFLKLFHKAGARDKKFNETSLALDKHINRLRRLYDDLLKKTNVLNYIEDPEGLELDEYFPKINELFEFLEGLKKDLKSYREHYFRRIRMASLSLFSDKSYQEIESLIKIINKMIEEYKHIEEAYDYYYYNSGELIINTINTLVAAMINSGNKNYIETYKYSYFLDSDFVMVLRFTEWTMLFSKLLYVKRNVNNVELFDYLSFKNYYEELERRYIVMLIYNEINQK